MHLPSHSINLDSATTQIILPFSFIVLDNCLWREWISLFVKAAHNSKLLFKRARYFTNKRPSGAAHLWYHSEALPPIQKSLYREALACLLLGVCGGESFSQSQTDALLMKRINRNTHQVLLSSGGQQLPYYVTYNLGAFLQYNCLQFWTLFKKIKNFNIRPNKFIHLKFLLVNDKLNFKESHQIS